VQHRRIAVATVLTLVAGAAVVVLSFGLAESDSVESDKPRPPMIILTHLDGEGGESGE
jgi:hypothetical protein